MVGWMDGQRDVMKLVVASCNFVNEPKNIKVKIYKTLIMPFLNGCKTLSLT
jgi:hypothetical protein